MKLRNSFLTRLKYHYHYFKSPHKITFFDEKKDLETAKNIRFRGNRVLIDSFKIGLVRDVDDLPYYTKFRRYLDYNHFSYDYYNLYGSNWQEEAADFDIIIYRPCSYPWSLADARDKIYFLEKVLGKKCLPSYRELKFYENKLYQYYLLKEMGAPLAPTFISTDYREVMAYVQRAEYPLVTKIRTGSGSAGVRLLKNRKQAKRLVEKIFRRGAPTYWPFLRQKNYVYFQKYIENEGFDLRVIVIDSNHIFGYYREPRGSDFRASGSGLVVKKALPEEVVRAALTLAHKLDFNMFAVDFVQSVEDKNYYIIEASVFIQVITSVHLVVDGKAGRYSYNEKTDSLEFIPGHYWLQELVLNNFLEKIE